MVIQLVFILLYGKHSFGGKILIVNQFS